MSAYLKEFVARGGTSFESVEIASPHLMLRNNLSWRPQSAFSLEIVSRKSFVRCVVRKKLFILVRLFQNSEVRVVRLIDSSKVQRIELLACSKIQKIGLFVRSIVRNLEKPVLLVHSLEEKVKELNSIVSPVELPEAN